MFLGHHFVKNIVTITIAVLSVFCTSCTNYTGITEMTYHGPAVCRGAGGMVEESHGIPIWSGGTPDRKYHVLCGIEFEWIEDGTETASKKYLEAVATVIYMARAKGAHAMINIGFESKTIGHRQTIPIKANKQYFQLIQYL